jgi:hypothetical protein
MTPIEEDVTPLPRSSTTTAAPDEAPAQTAAPPSLPPISTNLLAASFFLRPPSRLGQDVYTNRVEAALYDGRVTSVERGDDSNDSNNVRTDSRVGDEFGWPPELLHRSIWSVQ